MLIKNFYNYDLRYKKTYPLLNWKISLIVFKGNYFECFYNNLNFFSLVNINAIFNFNNLLSSYAPFLKTLIIKGIGFRSEIIENLTSSNDFPFFRYLSIRVGRSFTLYLPVIQNIGLKVEKKNRKLIIFGLYKEMVSNFMKTIYKLRPPSVYTGRGIRIKRFTHIKKLGKKDSKKGRFF